MPNMMTAMPNAFIRFIESVRKKKGDAIATHMNCAARSGYKTVSSPFFNAKMNKNATMINAAKPAMSGMFVTMESKEKSSFALANLKRICAVAERNDAMSTRMIAVFFGCMREKSMFLFIKTSSNAYSKTPEGTMLLFGSS